jgi:UDP-N-acetylglucosamine acyltransferase
VNVIHPSAIVDPAAQIGEDVSIGPWCVVGPDVILEDGVRLISHTVVDGITRIGPGSVLYPFVTVGMAPQDLKYKGEPTRTEIGARCHLREHVTVHRGTVTGSGVTKVGDGCLLMAGVHIAHDCEIGDGVVIANNVLLGGHVHIGANAVVGGGAAVHQFTRIGRAAMIGGMAGVTADVIPFGTVIGNRAYLAGLNIIGLRRRGYERNQINAVRAAFRLMFLGPGVFNDRVEEARTNYGAEPLVSEMLAFIDSCGKRGLIHAAVEEADEELV